ncbi:MAG: MJ0042-type zinc finger domain-containing protein [Xanthobacteraceae bacterium]
MHIVCPNCAASYQVSASAIGTAGRCAAAASGTRRRCPKRHRSGSWASQPARRPWPPSSRSLGPSSALQRSRSHRP